MTGKMSAEMIESTRTYLSDNQTTDRPLLSAALALLRHVDATAPREATSTDELEALPDMSVIQSDNGSVKQKKGGEWYYTSDAAAPEESADMEVPVLVIYVPEGEA